MENKSNETKVCPICKNKCGFVCGMCIECGWNYLSSGFDKIEVYVGDLPPELRARLIGTHYNNKIREGD